MDPITGSIAVEQGVMVLNQNEGRFRYKEKKITVKVVKHYSRLPRDGVDALSLEIFKVRQSRSLSKLTSLRVSLPMAGELTG